MWRGHTHEVGRRTINGRINNDKKWSNSQMEFQINYVNWCRFRTQHDHPPRQHTGTALDSFSLSLGHPHPSAAKKLCSLRNGNAQQKDGIVLCNDSFTWSSWSVLGTVDMLKGSRTMLVRFQELGGDVKSCLNAENVLLVPGYSEVASIRF